VFHEAHSHGFQSANGSWSGMLGQVSRGNAEVAVGDFIVSKDRSEVVAFTDTLGIKR